MTGAEALARLTAAYDDRLGEARRRKAAGATIVGYFLNSVPVELIVAVGLDPVRLVGDPGRRASIADRYMEEYMDGEVRSIFGSMLTGDFDFADLVVIPRTSEVYLQLYYFLREMPRWEPDAPVPETYLFDLLQSPHWLTARWDESRMRSFAKRLETLGGRPVDDGALAEAIRLCNRLRSALQAASSLWRGETRLDGIDALKVIGAASVLAPEDAIAALDALAADPPEPLPSAPRLLLKGSPQSDPHVTALIEAAGGRVVAHDHVAGDPTFRALVAENDAPWEALAGHYQRHILGPRVHPQADQDAHFIALAQEAAIDGVIFFHDEWDDTLGWEYPDQRQLLEARGIPSLFLKRQPYFDPPAEDQRAAISDFLSQIAKVPA
ncbi:2-hydroxyacyl-CoA dehydratase [Sphingomonas gilva]|uniref:2-hydroxyacyl-CoA dehydratase n=1 Tax=Sphingomonas gilva TaxID=2305907 RepID=A0A396RS39_9SPHN|nr:2-hydroxyacyl-CoA dehydratase family protein [Sphingomonas gilva]RHW19484.1 2-hydroxyacyl-CoA dehydratase [Sphingomonas gilva]